MNPQYRYDEGSVVLKSTGVVRRIDELGRIVIPKEIRRNLRIRDGENLEIFIENEAIYLKKISKMADFKDLADTICEQLHVTLKIDVAITDREKVICAKGEVLSLVNNSVLDKKLLDLIDNREGLSEDTIVNFDFGGNLVSGYFAIQPLITSVDSLGLVVIYSENPMDSSIKNIAKFIASIVAGNIDVDN